MAEFYVSLSVEEMASQIASLLNKHNKLYKKHKESTIIGNAETNYFVEVVHNTVIGCVGSVRKSERVTELKHVCVDPAYRRRGIASKLSNLAIANCSTEFVSMSVREDNKASLNMAKSMGFIQLKKHWSVDHYVITLGRAKDHAKWQAQWGQN